MLKPRQGLRDTMIVFTGAYLRIIQTRGGGFVGVELPPAYAIVLAAKLLVAVGAKWWQRLALALFVRRVAGAAKGGALK